MTTTPPSSPVPKKSRKLIYIFLVFDLITAIAIGTWFWWGHRTYHVAEVQESVLYRSGNRGAKEFANGVEQNYIKTVISLIDDNELNNEKKPQFKEEADYLKSKSVNLDRIPVQLGGWPSSDDLQKFFAIVADKKNQPVLVHCAQGVRRTGMFVAAYQMSVMNYDKAKARQSIQTFGHSDNTIADITKFIDSYDPATKSVPTTMPVGSGE